MSSVYDVVDYNKLVSFIWSVADDCLRDVYVRGKYRDVILPMTIIARFDAIIDAEKTNILQTKEWAESSGWNIHKTLDTSIDLPFYNISKFRLKDLKSETNSQNLKKNFEEYLDGFSNNIKEILEKFEFNNQLTKMTNAGILGSVIEKFTSSDLNLSPYDEKNSYGIVVKKGLDNHAMGTLFEEIIRKFNEENNEEAGEHFTPRDVVELMADIAVVPVMNKIKNGTYSIYDGACGTFGMSQFAAGTLTKNGESYKNVLKRYYTDIKLSTVESVLGKDKEIKVGITTNGSLEHGRLTIFSSENKVQIYNDDFDITVGENERVDVRNSSGTVTITLENGKTYKTKNPLNFYAKGEYLTLSPVRKGHTSSPRYRGVITIIPRGSNLRVINTLDIEKYLLQVVPSEMPKSFGVEALKVQAVAARTYAVSDILKGKYAQDGFHIKDTVESQVYNNQVENEEATRAIEETEGEIMTYDNMPIDAKYFSTSSGFTSHASNVW